MKKYKCGVVFCKEGKHGWTIRKQARKDVMSHIKPDKEGRKRIKESRMNSNISARVQSEEIK